MPQEFIMFYYTPKLIHAIITATLCIVLMLIGVRVGGKYQTVMNIGAMMFAVMTAIVLWMLIVDSYRDLYDSKTRFINAFVQLDDEGRAALAFQFPAMRYRLRRGQPRAYFEDTNVTIEQFRLFLETSNSKYISPERDWSTSNKPRAVWMEIKDWLETNDKIIPDSAAGSHSWKWNGNSYHHLMAYWLAGRTLPDLNEETV